MNKKVLIISSSPRKGGNSETLAAAFAKGAQATPVYYYCVSGQLKTLLDRANPLYDSDYAFTKAYLLATAAEDAPETFDGTEKAVQGWVDCFPRCTLAGTVFAGGVNGVGEIAGHIALEQAYQAGKEV